MKRIVLIFTALALMATFGFSKEKLNYKTCIRSEKNVFKTGLLFKDPGSDPLARRISKVLPAGKAIDNSKYKATSCDNSQYLPPVDSQGSQGSCVAWAIGYYYKTYQENRENNRTSMAEREDAHNICSPAYIYNLIHIKEDDGALFSDAFRVLNVLGCSSLAEMQYTSSDYMTWPSTDAFKNGMYNRTQAPIGYAMNYLKLDDDLALEQVKQLLLNGLVVTLGISVYGNYDNISNYNNIYAVADETGTNRGGHAQCIVGFDDTIVTPDGTGAFRVVNSWGTNWGDNGFYWMSYEAIKYASDLSQGYIYWVDDRIDYQPSCYALVNISHPYSRQTVPEFTGSNGQSFEILYFSANSDQYDYNPYPSTDIAVDLSDIHPADCEYVIFQVNYNSYGNLSNGEDGTINSCKVDFIDTGDQYTSLDVPVDFYYSTGGGAAFVYFTSTSYTISASANEGGVISPMGDCTASEGSSKAFAINSDDGYHIKDVLVDGESVGVVALYTFHNINSSHTIEALFEVDQEFYTITGTAVSEGGSVDPSGEIQVEQGTDQLFTITPDEGYFINDVLVDGQSVGRISTYNFANVSASHSINAVFSTSLPPEISYAETKTISVVAPSLVQFECEASDPDGGGILQYIWEIQGNEIEKILSLNPCLGHIFRSEGVYTVKVTVVDDEGEMATAVLTDSHANQAKITVFKPESVPVVIPSVAGIGKNKQIILASMDTNFINTNDSMTTLTIHYLGGNGSVLDETIKQILPYGRLVLNGNEGIPANCVDVVTYADNCPLVYSSVSTENAKMTAYLSSFYHGSLNIPHIAEQTNYWDTVMYLVDLQPGPVDIRVADIDNRNELVNQGNFIDLEAFLPQSGDENSGVGLVRTISNNPFQSERNSLSGFEMFVHNGTDGAAVELSGYGHRTLFLPHIPEATDIFWTGFTIVNTDETVQANVTIQVYSGDGQMRGEKSLTIPASGKMKGTVEDLFPDLYGQLQWGMIQSDRDIVGIEIYGTVDSGICGFDLPSIATTEGYLPEILNGDGLWTGIGITNPGNNDTSVNIQLVDKDGSVKVEKTQQVAAKHRFTVVVSQLFENTVISDGDYIRYASDLPVIGLVVTGDTDRTFMTALIGRK
ncbi:MAG: hypothetical protein KAH24_01245 [Holophagae bacterium]|nr:hypothetical protein [Holophagae bacterium]